MRHYFFIVFIFLTLAAFGQHKAEEEFYNFLRVNKIDTFIYVKSGCTNCTISYEETIKPADTVTITLLYRQKGTQYLVAFTDTARTKEFGKADTDIFTYILANRQILKDKDAYYKEAKQAKFQAPCMMIFPYEIIDIKIGQLKYRHTLVQRETDDCGTALSRKDWFIIELSILNKFDKMKKIE